MVLNINQISRLTILLCVISTSAAAIPSIGVPNITVSPSIATPSFISTEAVSSSDIATKQMLQQQMSNFSAQIRGNILQSGQFRVVDVDNNFAQSYAPAESIPVESTIINNESEHLHTVKTIQKSNTPEYMLIGSLSAINAGEEVNQIINTNKYSDIYSIDLAVDYKLVRTSDRTIVASFTAAGHSGDVKLVGFPDQRMQHNIPLLVQQVGADLANEVTTQLNAQIGNGKLFINSQESAPKVTDFTTYKD